MFDTATQKTQTHLHVAKHHQTTGGQGAEGETVQSKCEMLCPFPTYTKQALTAWTAAISI